MSNPYLGFRCYPCSRQRLTMPKLCFGSRGHTTALRSLDMARSCLRRSPGSQVRYGAPSPFDQTPTSRAFHSHYHHVSPNGWDGEGPSSEWVHTLLPFLMRSWRFPAVTTEL